MKQKMVKAIWAVCALTSAGCATINFERGGAHVVSRPDVGAWHQIGILGLVEFSKPVNVYRMCSGRGWQKLTTEQTFVQGLVGALAGGWYTPWQVDVVCASGY